MKIVISDFDLCFYDDNFLDNIKLINKLVDDGNIFVIATGRSLLQLRSVIDDYEIKASYYICNDGGVIYDHNYQEIYRKDIDSATSKEIFDYLVSTKFFDKVLIDTTKTYTEISTACCNCLIGIIKDHNNAFKVLNHIISNYPDVNGYITKNLYITEKTVNKATAIEFLAVKNNWPKQNIYTVGDDINDLEMIQEYNSFVIGNKLKKIDSNLKIVSSFKETIKTIK